MFASPAGAAAPVRSKDALPEQLIVPSNVNGCAPVNVMSPEHWMTFAAFARIVPPASTSSVVNFTGFSHARMSSVPPAWIFTGTACAEIAISGL